MAAKRTSIRFPASLRRAWLRALDTDKFEAIEVGITKNGEWIVDGEDPRKWNMSEGLPMVEKTDSSKDVVLDVALGRMVSSLVKMTAR